MFTLNPIRILIFSLPLINFGPLDGGKLTFAHLLSLVFSFFWMLKGKIFLPYQALSSGAIFLAIIGLNVALTIISTGSTEPLKQFINYICMFNLMVVGYSYAKQKKIDPRIILINYYNAGLLYGALSLGVYIYGVYNADFLFQVTEFFNNAGTFDLGAIAGDWTDELLPRISGFSPEPSFWAMYLCTVFAVGYILQTKFISFSMLFVMVVISLTLARTGLVIFLAMTLYILLSYSKIIATLFVSTCFFILLFFVDLSAFDLDDSMRQRFGSLYDGWEAFLLKPMFGLGMTGFKIYATNNNLDYPIVFNYYLHILAEMGLIGFLSLIPFIFSLIRGVAKEFHIILLSIFVAWLSAPSYNLPYAWFLFGVLLAMQKKCYKVEKVKYE